MAAAPPPPPSRADQLALRVLSGPAATAPGRMRALFAREQVKSSHQRRVRDLVYRALAWRQILSHAFARATRSDVANLRPQLDLMALAVLADEASPAQAQAAYPQLDWQIVRAAPTHARAIQDPATRVATLAGLPQPFGDALAHALGADATAFAASCLAPAPVCLRANLLHNDRDVLRAQLAADGVVAQPCRFAPHGLLVTKPAQLLGTRAYRDGRFELQDEASQLVAALVGAAPGMQVADVCAGAGGKTLALAAQLRNRGRLLALDSDAPRLRDLAQRCRRGGVTCVHSERVAPDHWSPQVMAELSRCDRILLDAPCSGLGTLRRAPELRAWLETADLTRLRDRQRELLGRAARALRPGARLVYATCSVLPLENQDAVAELCAQQPLRVVPAVELLGETIAPLCGGDGQFLATRPDRDGCDGFFAAVLERR